MTTENELTIAFPDLSTLSENTFLLIPQRVIKILLFIILVMDQRYEMANLSLYCAQPSKLDGIRRHTKLWILLQP
jgi:hypothetical protein